MRVILQGMGFCGTDTARLFIRPQNSGTGYPYAIGIFNGHPPCLP